MKKIFCLSILLILAVFETHGQFNGNNLAEFQQGKLPTDTTTRGTFYNRFLANYSYKKFKVSTTFESFLSPQKNSTYANVSQLSVQYRTKYFDFKAGNFYETIGRGTLVRSFEIPGAILEDLSYRSRHYFNRDIFGINAKFNYKNLSSKFIYGRPLNYVFPPSAGEKLRRPDTIIAFYSDYTFKKQTLGFATMKILNESSPKVFIMGNASGNIFQNFTYNTEIAKSVTNESLAEFSSRSTYAIYSSLNFAKENFGLSAEYKNYNQFILGSGINEPPALIKEHSYRVLNRSTQVLQPLNETGYQIEAFFTFPNESNLVINNTVAINNFAEKFVFKEYFIEYTFNLKEKNGGKVFFDYAIDPFKLQKNRYSSGIVMDWKLTNSSSLKTEYEMQTFRRENEIFSNYVFVLGFAYKSKIITSLVTEYSNDSFIVKEGAEYWMGANVKYQVNKKNNIQMFVGERRGGPACNAGVCYEVLDFSGFEMRLTSRF